MTGFDGYDDSRFIGDCRIPDVRRQPWPGEVTRESALGQALDAFLAWRSGDEKRDSVSRFANFIS